jgi:predicted phosphodiesterase
LASNTPPKEKKVSAAEQALLSERSKKFDPTATPEDCIADLRDVQKRYPNKSITRNFYRVEGKYSDRTWDSKFGTFEEFKSQAKLQLNRAQRHLEKHIARHAHLDNYREFQKTEITPWVGKYEKTGTPGRMKTIIVSSDWHDKDTDTFALDVFIDTCERVQPDIIVFAGDTYDCFEFSSYDIDPRLADIRGRHDFVREKLFRRTREACPNSQIDFIIGNHEHRILRMFADKTPNLKVLADVVGFTFSKLLQLDEFQINLVSKSDLAAYSPKEVREEAKKNYQVYYDCLVVNHYDENFGMSCISGHTHKPKLTTKCVVGRGPIFSLTLGSMCHSDQEYHQAMVNGQTSFAICHIDTKKKEVIPEHIQFSSEVAIVGGKYYFRS